MRLRSCTHGASYSPEYKAWVGMLDRCSSTHVSYYSRYKNRGITVCAEWKQSFIRFLADVGHRPSPAHSLDRIDNEGHYTPCNVRWATRHEQANNTRTNRRVAWRGRVQTIAQWSRELNICDGTLRKRFQLGWSVERAFLLASQRSLGVRDSSGRFTSALPKRSRWKPGQGTK